jgi:hypothetical protein
MRKKRKYGADFVSETSRFGQRAEQMRPGKRGNTLSGKRDFTQEVRI